MPIPVDDLREQQRCHEAQGYVHWPRLVWAMFYTADPVGVLVERLCPYCYRSGIPVEDRRRIHRPGFYPNLQRLVRGEFGLDIDSPSDVGRAREAALKLLRDLERVYEKTDQLLKKNPKATKFSVIDTGGKMKVLATVAGATAGMGVVIATGGAAWLFVGALVAAGLAILGSAVDLPSLFKKVWSRDQVRDACAFVVKWLTRVRNWVEVYRNLPRLVRDMRRSPRPTSSPQFKTLTRAVQEVSAAGEALNLNPSIFAMQELLRSVP